MKNERVTSLFFFKKKKKVLYHGIIENCSREWIHSGATRYNTRNGNLSRSFDVSALQMDNFSPNIPFVLTKRTLYNKLCNKKRERRGKMIYRENNPIVYIVKTLLLVPAIPWTGYIDIISTLGSPLPPEPLLPFWKELPRPPLILYPICYAPRAWSGTGNSPLHDA